MKIQGGAQGGLFEHGASYISGAAKQAGFEVIDFRRELHEYVGPRPDYAYVVTRDVLMISRDLAARA